jgi:hypothetical protein
LLQFLSDRVDYPLFNALIIDLGANRAARPRDESLVEADKYVLAVALLRR